MADVTITDLPTITPSRGLTVPASDGTTTGKLTITQIADQIVPIGSILLWSGSIASIPANWSLCNGTNGTPNLTNRFVIGAGAAYAVNGTGGSATASGATDATTLTEAQMPAHAHVLTDPGHFHTFPRLTGAGYNTGTAYAAGGFLQDNASTTTKTTGISIAATGGGTGHSHTISSVSTIPPYYALAYIMRTS
jgi:microcystin-dependent protein